MTPLPSSTVEGQPWSQLARASAPDTSMSAFGVQNHVAQYQQYQDAYKNSTRPRSSPSTFGPTSESIPWPLTNGLGIFPNGPIGQPTPVTSTFPPNVFQSYAADDQYVKDETSPKEGQQSIASSTPEIRQPQPRRPYANIQPDPVGAAAVQKRKRDDDDLSDLSATTKRRKRTSSVVSADLSEDDRLLVSLKEEQNLPWKDIASRYSAEKGKTVQVAALQMKYKRLREKYRVWTEPDVGALRQAYEMWEKRKWEIISEKVSSECETLSAVNTEADWRCRCSNLELTNAGILNNARGSGKRWKWRQLQWSQMRE
jgi:hypothetical protein